jgi:signal transduction histidine kinase/CheY-like chemotaxis protein
MKFTLNNKTTLLFCLAIAVFITVLVIYYFSTQYVDVTSDLVGHTQKVLHTLFLGLLLAIIALFLLVAVIIKNYQKIHKDLETYTTSQKIIKSELLEAKVFAELATGIAEEAQNKAESAVKSKQQFLSNMSHEIRTPLNGIIGFTKVILKTDLTAKQKEYLTAIKMSGDALIVLINDILDLAKVDAGKMTFEQTPFKLASSISAMLHLFDTKVQEKNLILLKEYDPKIPTVLVGDPIRLHQIILNLVSNAVKFTALGQIKVSVRLLKEDADTVSIEFAVADTGIGIAEDKMEKIFENFQQASSNTSRLYGGTGLGLAIAKQLVESQGGTIKVHSRIDEGSIFSFILGFQKTNAQAEMVTDILEVDKDIKNIKVLVVEDMALNQLLMKTILDDFGFERDIADNGKIAIEKLKTKSYDIILMDLQMPEMNGFEATDYIRNTLKSKIPIIALTADVTTVDVAKCKAVGMNDYIAKPVDERLLYSKIVGLVKKTINPVTYKENTVAPNKKIKYTNMDYLIQRTKANPTLMMEIIAAYLEQTPPLITSMKQSFHSQDWEMLHASVHKMIPSFAIMGISTDFEKMAKKVMEHAQMQQETDTILDFVTQLENVCLQACEELTIELNSIKNGI